MFSVDSISQLNAQAVELMRRGQNIHASSVLHTALNAIHSILRDLDLPDEISYSTPITKITSLQNNPFQHSRRTTSLSNNSSEGSPPSPLIEGASSTNGLGESVPGKIGVPRSCHDLAIQQSLDLPGYYAKPFDIYAANSSKPIPHDLRIAILAEVSSALLFNMALANHRQGIIRGASAYFQTSLRLYQEALSQLHAVAPVWASSVPRLILISAIHQNKSLIYMQLSDFAPAKQEIQWMGETVAHLEVVLLFSWGGQEYFIPDHLQEDLRFFRLQLAFLRMYNFQFATAA